ncbi:MAG: hypothetical protein U9N59_16505 [Campylobacterota bacterium]|nr:hypothetical protein [Campylobacterota bacterium]
MRQIGIVDINRTPSIIDKLDVVVQVVNKKTKDIKGYFIPIMYEEMIKKTIEEIEYQNFKLRNKSLIHSSSLEDDSLLDGIEDVY